VGISPQTCLLYTPLGTTQFEYERSFTTGCTLRAGHGDILSPVKDCLHLSLLFMRWLHWCLICLCLNVMFNKQFIAVESGTGLSGCQVYNYCVHFIIHSVLLR